MPRICVIMMIKAQDFLYSFAIMYNFIESILNRYSHYHLYFPPKIAITNILQPSIIFFTPLSLLVPPSFPLRVSQLSFSALSQTIT